MATEPLVSVVVPSYNHEDFIAETVRSIIEQDYPNIELVIVDDGSTDDSVSVIESLIGSEHASKLTNIIFEVKENEGLIKTLNRGFCLSNGEYIAQVASDDLLTQGQIRAAVELFEAHHCGLVFGNPFLIKGGVKTDLPIYRRDSWLRSMLKRPDCVFQELLRKNFLPASTIVYNKAVFSSCGLMDPLLVNRGEISLHWKIARRHQFCMLPGHFGYYRTHDHSTWLSLKTDYKKLEAGYISLLDNFAGEFPDVRDDVDRAKRYVSYDYKKKQILDNNRSINKWSRLILHLLKNPKFAFHDFQKVLRIFHGN